MQRELIFYSNDLHEALLEIADTDFGNAGDRFKRFFCDKRQSIWFQEGSNLLTGHLLRKMYR